MGGLEKNKHADKELYAGGGTVGKTPVASVKDRTHPGALVYTDDAPAYRGLPHHEAVRHGVNEWVNDQVHRNGLESSWSLLKFGHYYESEAPRPLCGRIRRALQRPRHHRPGYGHRAWGGWQVTAIGRPGRELVDQPAGGNKYTPSNQGLNICANHDSGDYGPFRDPLMPPLATGRK